MPSESSNPDFIPPTETPLAPAQPETLGPLSLASSPPSKLALTAVQPFQTEAAPEAVPPSPSIGEARTIALGPSKQAGPSTPRSPGRFPRYLGEYELLEEIARGGMGVVYRARQEKLNRLVAVKLIRSASLAGADDL